MKLMGILNATPDSFWSGSRYSQDQAVEQGLKLVAQGAQVLDIGGESTRPGASYVEAKEELARVVPVIEGLVAQGCTVPISVDTRKRTVMEAAHKAGATWLNDVSALEDDATLAPFAAETGLTVVLMHRQGHPDRMQHGPTYTDVAQEVYEYLARRAQWALQQGISSDRIVVDPGFGFGKTFEHSLSLFGSLSRLKALGFPVLVGLSRKSFLGQLSGAPVEDRLIASVTAVLAAAEQGVLWARVHDVAATRQALQVWTALKGGV